MRFYLAALTVLALTACAGKVDYIRPTTRPDASANSKVIDKPRESVWNASVPALSKQFFVINNLDKSSGLINVSYNGDPEKYIDCGRITSFVKNARGERTYNFAGAAGQQSYEIMNPNGLFIVNRTMTLDGRVNLVFEEVTPTRTRVTANTRYVVQRQQTVRNMNNQSQAFSNSISFNSGGGASFPPADDGRAAECVSNGFLEREILNAIQ